HLVVERHPASERQHRDLQSAAAEPAVLHLVFWRLRGHQFFSILLWLCLCEDCVQTCETGRTAIPAAAIAALASAIACSPKWKMLAASTPVAPPSRMPSTRCCMVPTPP